jgi:rhodanese-related sulfurtransferase
MNYDYFFIALAVAYIGWRLWSSYSARRRVPELKREGAQLVDVRSPGEFASGHASGSVNIPLSELDSRVKELDPNRWVVVACASGSRSAMAAHRLRRLGFRQVMNAGSWRNLG